MIINKSVMIGALTVALTTTVLAKVDSIDRLSVSSFERSGIFVSMEKMSRTLTEKMSDSTPLEEMSSALSEKTSDHTLMKKMTDSALMRSYVAVPKEKTAIEILEMGQSFVLMPDENCLDGINVRGIDYKRGVPDSQGIIIDEVREYNYAPLIEAAAKASDLTYKLYSQVATGKVEVNKTDLVPFFDKNGQVDGFVSYEQVDGKPRVTVAYRGTKNFSDWYYTNFNSKGVDTNSVYGFKGEVHRGFQERYLSTRDNIQDIICSLLEGYGKSILDSDVEFVFTGHSMGGAQATLAAVDLIGNLGDKANVKLITFNSPTVFDGTAAIEAQRRLGSNALRLTRGQDPVSSVGYGIIYGEHVGTHHKLDANHWNFLMGIKGLKPKPLPNHCHALNLKDAAGENGKILKDHVYNPSSYQTKEPTLMEKIGQKVKAFGQKVSSGLSKVANFFGW